MAKNKIISDRLNTFFTNNKMTVGESIPATGTWSKGDIVISTIQANGECGWICVEAGTPGRWEIFGAGGRDSLVAINASEIVNNSVTEVTLSGLGVGVSPSDKLLVHYNSTHLFEGVDFEIVEEGTKIRKLGGGSWNESNEPNTLFAFELLKTVKSIDGDKICIDTKIIELKNNINITSPVSEVAIGIEGFNKSSDVLTVYKNSNYMIEGIDYNIDVSSKKIVSLKGNWNQSSESECRFTFVVLKEVSDISPNATVNTNNLVNGSFTMEKLADDVRQAILDAGNIDLTAYVKKSEVGDLNNLQTENRTNLVSAINEVFQSGVNAKQGLVEALTSKNVETSTSESWESLNNKVKTNISNNPPSIRKGVQISNCDVDNVDKIPSSSICFSHKTIHGVNYRSDSYSPVKYHGVIDLNQKTLTIETEPSFFKWNMCTISKGSFKYFVGGNGSNSNELLTNMMYDELTKTWTGKSDAPENFNESMRSIVVEDNIFVKAKNKVYKYDNISDTWSIVSNEDTVNRTGAVPVYYKGKIYYVGGDDVYKSVIVFDIEAGTLSNLSPLPSKGLYNMGVGITSDGKLFTVGGYYMNSQYTTPYNYVKYLDLEDSNATWKSSVLSKFITDVNFPKSTTVDNIFYDISTNGVIVIVFN